MTDITPCPGCGSTEHPNKEFDSYDQVMTCTICGWSTGWCYVAPTAKEGWIAAYNENQLKGVSDVE